MSTNEDPPRPLCAPADGAAAPLSKDGANQLHALSAMQPGDMRVTEQVQELELCGWRKGGQQNKSWSTKQQPPRKEVTQSALGLCRAWMRAADQGKATYATLVASRTDWVGAGAGEAELANNSAAGGSSGSTSPSPFGAAAATTGRLEQAQLRALRARVSAAGVYYSE